MKRRSFIKKSAAASTLVGLGSQGITALTKSKNDLNSGYNFKLKFAPHLGMFTHHAGKDPVDQLHFMADQGFTAFEDNGMKKRTIDTQKAMAKAMTDRGMTMGVFVAHKIDWKTPTLTSGNADKREKFLDEIKESIEVALRLNAKWMTVVPGFVDMKQDFNYQTQHVIEALKQASAILEPHKLTMVLEPLNFYNHPGLFLSKSPQAYQICKAVNSPSCKILFDIYHQQIQEGNLLPNIDTCWDEIAYFQIGDNPGRHEPTTGEINYKNIFKHIYAKGYQGVLGMEHKNSIEGINGELAVIHAYKETSNF
ncbi:hydroxypyruvate isomerase family protein [Algibacter mikhailovii]|uniref:hydroxypyruvate isomerase family protein n=1 Tax=Algibacter mikhailovii TaxID=425498 RepID=UPI002494FE3C|nr:TIM barrel protein [Algibacter mikhailovii]